MPSFAVTVVIPLVDLTIATGSTRVWKKTHQMVQSQEHKMSESFVLLMSTGSCYLMDYQLVHGGTANTSYIVRPILYLIYYRSWFREIVNLEKQKRIEISRAEYARIPTHYQFLFKDLDFNQPKQDFSSLVGSENYNLVAKKFHELDSYNQEQRLSKLAQVALKDYGLENAVIKLIAHRENTTFSVEIPGEVQKTTVDSPYLSNHYLLRIYRGNYL